jgi:cytidine deaminase
MKTETLTCTYDVLQYNELTPVEQQLVDEAKAQTRHSYAPYSAFSVGAALRLDDGRTLGGNNQENCAYPSAPSESPSSTPTPSTPSAPYKCSP